MTHTMSPDTITAEALKRAGVTTYDNDSFRTGLALLTKSILKSGQPNATGYMTLQTMMTDFLAARFKAERYWKENPAVATAPVTAPLFVMGMPRTGTTLALNLLDQDPARRTMKKWEVTNPVPPATTVTLRTDPRCLAMLETQKKAVEEKRVRTDIHYEWAYDPTECVFVHASDFRSMLWEASVRMPEYSEFMMTCDMTDTYAWHKRMLQVLQTNAPGQWTLKAPSHALYIDDLLEIYPDARFVMTHRHPLVAVASLASLMASAEKRFCDDADLDWIRRHYPAYGYEHVRRAMTYKSRAPDRVYDLDYQDLMTDPINAMRDLYAWLGTPLTAEVEKRFKDWLTAHPIGKLGKHKYGLADFGIEPDDVLKLFKDYLDVYRFKDAV